jgi:hypothetical protein
MAIIEERKKRDSEVMLTISVSTEATNLMLSFLEELETSKSGLRSRN